jgi:hypothetical protein
MNEILKGLCSLEKVRTLFNRTRERERKISIVLMFLFFSVRFTFEWFIYPSTLDIYVVKYFFIDRCYYPIIHDCIYFILRNMIHYKKKLMTQFERILTWQRIWIAFIIMNINYSNIIQRKWIAASFAYYKTTHKTCRTFSFFLS